MGGNQAALGESIQKLGINGNNLLAINGLKLPVYGVSSVDVSAGSGMVARDGG